MMLAQTSEESLARKPHEKLVKIARQAGIYRPWLNRWQIAQQLVHWRRAERERIQITIARLRHEQIVMKAALKSLYVSPENFRKYGFDVEGRHEATVLGVSVSHAMQLAPGAMAAAKELSQQEFMTWVDRNPAETRKLALIRPGILADRGAMVWKSVQNAFASPEVPPLFADVP